MQFALSSQKGIIYAEYTHCFKDKEGRLIQVGGRLHTTQQSIATN